MQVNPDLYHVVRYSGKGDTRRIEFTNEGYKLAAVVAFKGRFKPLSGQAVKMLLECVNQTRFDSTRTSYSPDVVNELMDPWGLAHDGAVIWPEEFQPWQADNEAFFETDNPKFLGGNWICSTYHADEAAALINAQLEKLKARIRLNEGLCAAA